MGGRDRKRAERHKRKQRSAQRETDPAGGRGSAKVPTDPDHLSGVTSAGRDRSRRSGDRDQRPSSHNGGKPAGIEELAGQEELSRSERKNQAAREALVPLATGERPRVVTIGAIVSTLLFVAAIAGWLLWNSLRDDTRPALVAVLLFAAVVGTMAYGMWRVRYWAVLGFQAVLLFSILGSALGIVRAATVLDAVGNLIVLVGAGALFYFMVKALARIQMPERGARH
jgi:hypothetical protein